MSWRDQRNNIVVGGVVTIFPIVVIILLSSIRGSSSITSPAPVKAESIEQPAPSFDVAETMTVPPLGRSEESLVTTVDTSPPSSDSPPNVQQCTLSGVPLGYGSFGDDIFCLQFTLTKIELFAAEQDGLFGDSTLDAVRKFQSLQKLHVDGVVGRKTGTKLGIWPLDPFTVERTPVPPPGAVDVWGLPLSSVAASGPDSPPLPANSGSGYRLVYDRAAQRVWAVDETETVIRSWLVSGSREGNELAGTHKVYSRSKSSVSRDGESYFSYMVRWLRTRNDAIGFHSLPRRTLDDSWYQTEDELGIRLSSGCQRQADLDAEFTWQFAPVGTTVVVL